MKTIVEKSEAVLALKGNKNQVPQYNKFNEDTHAKIDAMIDVITNDLDETDIYDKYSVWEDDDVREAALQALEWLQNDEDIEEYLYL